MKFKKIYLELVDHIKPISDIVTKFLVLNC
jgi:hypothetical protein